MTKFFPLVWSGLWHKRGRTILTFLAIISAFLLFGLLQGFLSAINQDVAVTRAERLIVMNQVIQREGLPFAYLSRVKEVKGVEQVSFLVGFRSSYQKPMQPFPATAVDPASYFPFMSEIKVPKEQVDAMIQKRTGIIIGKSLADRYNMKIGDHITITSIFFSNRDGSRNWEFDVVGIFEVPDSKPQENTAVVNYAYIDEGRQVNKGLVGQILVRVNDPEQASAISRSIDKLFENSSYETRSMSQSELAQSQLKGGADFNLIVRSIVGAVFFALLFSTGLVMMQSIRQRGRDLAILKTVGFTNAFVFRLIVVESAVITVLAACIGLGIAWASFPAIMSVLHIPILKMPPIVLPIGVGIAAVMALLTGAFPAWHAKRLRIVDALAGK